MVDVDMDTGDMDTGDVVQPTISTDPGHTNDKPPVYDRCFHNAAENGDIFKVERMIEAGGIEIDQKDCCGWTALQCAAMQGYGDTVDLLLEHGASVSAVNNRGETALLSALHMGQAIRYEHVVRSLLLHGSNVDTTGEHGMPAIVRATHSSSTAVIKMLLDYSPNLSASDDGGYTALHILSMRSLGSLQTKLKICRMLLNHGTCIEDKLYALTKETYPSDADDSEDSDGEPRRGWCVVRLAGLFRCPELQTMMKAEKNRLYDIDYSIFLAGKARAEAVKKTRQVALAMSQQTRLGAESAIAVLPLDVMKMIMKQV
jgi:hypothetical protein